MEKVKLKHVAIKNLGVVRDGSRGRWVKVQIGRLGVTETDNLISIIAKTAYYNSFKNIGGTIECVIWVRYDKSFVSAGDIFYGDVEFSLESLIRGGRPKAIELDSFTADATATYSWEFPGDGETACVGRIVETFSDVGVEVLDLEFVGGNRNNPYWAKIRLFDLSRSEVEKIKRIYERDPEDLPARTKCGERLEPGFELEFRPCKERPTALKEVTVVLYCKDYAPLKEIGAYSDSVDITLDNCEGAICPTMDATRVYHEIKVLEPEKRFGCAKPAETFTLMGVAIKTREVVQGYSEIYVCKINIGRMSETEKTKLESFVRRIGERRNLISISMVEGGKTIPGTREPLHTYEMYVYMATCPSPVVDMCDLKFKYVAERDMILAEVVDAVYAPLSGFRGINWFNDIDLSASDKFDEQRIRPIWTDAGLYDEGGEASAEIKSFVVTHARYIARRNGSHVHATKAIPIPEIEKIEFNEPATIIFWKDGTKTVVKARDGEPYDAEKGIAMAIAKKALGNQRDYYNTFIHWLKRYKKKLNAAPREKYVAPQLEILDDRITENPKKPSAKKKTTSKKGGKR